MKFKTEKISLKNVIDEDEAKQECRKKLMKFIEDNPEMDQYIKYIRNANNVICMLLGGLIAVIIGEILIIGMAIGDMI
jgi:hypothetical protein